MFRSGHLALFTPEVRGQSRWWVAALLAVSVLVPLGIPQDAAAQIVDVRVLDFNIHRDIGAADSNIGSQPELAKIVNYLKPDVWTINELGGNSSGFNRTTAHDLLSSFIRNDLTIFGPAPVEGVNYFLYVGEISDGFITNAIVSRYPLLETQTFSDAGGGFNALRGLELALVDIPGPTDIGLFTTHLKALNSNNDALRRQAEANADKATISTWMSSHTTAAALLTGDFNESETPRMRRIGVATELATLCPGRASRIARFPRCVQSVSSMRCPSVFVVTTTRSIRRIRTPGSTTFSIQGTSSISAVRCSSTQDSTPAANWQR
jgi:endonuclease/exonuclease/phosphatase family metal-dependent hydrolase